MTRLNIALLSLILPGALAVPRLHNRHEKYHSQSGLYPTGAPVVPSGASSAPYGYGNATSNGPAGTGTAPVIYSTVTVSPLPVTSNGAISSGAGGAGGAGAGSSYGGNGASSVNANAPTSGNSPVTGGSGSGTCGPATVTVTSANTVTVTVGAGGAGGAGSSAAGSSNLPTSLPATNAPVLSTNSAPFGNGTSSVGPIGTGTAPAGTGNTGNTGLPVYSGRPSASPSTQESPVAPISMSTTPLSTYSAPLNTVAPVSTPTTSLSAYSAPAANSAVAPVAESSAAPVGAPSGSSTVAAFYRPSAPSVVAPPPVAPSSSASSPSASPSSAPSTGDVKARGLAYQNAGLTDLFSSSSVGWGYNWGQTAGSLVSGVQFVPMLHDNQASSYSSWQSNAQSAISAGSTHLLAFNEPEQPASAGGCGMSAQEVIDGWNTHMKPLVGKAKLGSPAVTSQEGSDTAGLPLLKTFLDAFGADVDFVCIHWYGTEFSQFQQHISDAKKVANGKPIWLTEFAHNDPAQAQSFLGQALPWLDNPANGVERYAYQYVDTTLTAGQSLSSAGQLYAGKA